MSTSSNRPAPPIPPQEPTFTDFPLFGVGLSRPQSIGDVQAQVANIIDPATVTNGLVIDGNAVRQAVGLIMRIRKSEAFFAPDRGIIRDPILFSTIDEQQRMLIEGSLADDIKAQEDRISQARVQVIQDPNNNRTDFTLLMSSPYFGRLDLLRTSLTPDEIRFSASQ